MKKGIDISFARPDMAWFQRQRAAGFEVFIQCAWTGGLAGNDGIRAVCATNLRNAREAGMRCAAYVNAAPPDWWPDSVALQHIKSNVGSEWPHVQHFVIDVEIAGATLTRALSLAAALTAEGKTVEVLYTARWFWTGYMGNSQDGAWLRFKLWSAHYDGDPDIDFAGAPYGPWPGVIGEQYAGTTNLDGCDVDLNNFEDSAFGGGVTPPVEEDDMALTEQQEKDIAAAGELARFFAAKYQPDPNDPNSARTIFDQVWWTLAALDKNGWGWLFGEGNFPGGRGAQLAHFKRVVKEATKEELAARFSIDTATRNKARSALLKLLRDEPVIDFSELAAVQKVIDKVLKA